MLNDMAVDTGSELTVESFHHHELLHYNSLMSIVLKPEMITVDCANPRKLAQFWAKATDSAVLHDYDGSFVILDSKPRLGFQLVPDLTPGKNSIHVDFIAENREIAVADLEALGATVQSVQSLPDGEFMWTVMKDPEGNVFCVSDQEQ